MVWLLVQADWVRRVNGKSRAFWWAVANVCIIPALILLVAIEAAVQSAVACDMSIVTTITGIGTLCVAITGLCTVFILRYELECEPIGIELGKVATFFLGTIYFQYYLRHYNMENRAAVDGSLGMTS